MAGKIRKEGGRTKRSAPALKFKATVESFPEFAGYHYLEVSRANVQKLGGKFLLRLVCTVNGKVRYPCALQGLGNGLGWIGLSKARMKELGLKKGASVTVELVPDSSKYGMPMPPELRELLRQDPEGRRRFEMLRPGRQRNILHYVGQPKDTDRRLERAFKLIENLKQIPEGKETADLIFGTKSNFQRRS